MSCLTGVATGHSLRSWRLTAQAVKRTDLGMDTYERYQIDSEAYVHRAQTGPCFICKIIEGEPDVPTYWVYQDDQVIAFLDYYPRAVGYTLVAPRKHLEQVTGDFMREEYLAVQERVHRIAEAVRAAVGAERMYLLSLGSNQGNAHVHWHIVPLRSGVPYEQQQFGLWERGILRIPAEDMAEIAKRINYQLEVSDAV